MAIVQMILCSANLRSLGMLVLERELCQNCEASCQSQIEETKE
jgi:hypothetical protein